MKKILLTYFILGLISLGASADTIYLNCRAGDSASSFYPGEFPNKTLMETAACGATAEFSYKDLKFNFRYYECVMRIPGKENVRLNMDPNFLEVTVKPYDSSMIRMASRVVKNNDNSGIVLSINSKQVDLDLNCWISTY